MKDENHEKYVNWDHLRRMQKNLELISELLSIYERSEKLDEDQYLWYKKPIDGILETLKGNADSYHLFTIGKNRRVI